MALIRILNELSTAPDWSEARAVAAESRDAVFYRGYELRSAFQPILGITQGRVLGYEALLRPRDSQGRELPPLALFDMARGFNELGELNRLATGVHLASFRQQAPSNCWLFLNLNVAALYEFASHPGGLKAEVARHGLWPPRVVIEVMESDIAEDDAVSGLLRDYRRAGFMIAIDDFGAGFSNLSRIFALKPEIVKFDRELMMKRLSNPAMTHLFRHLAASLHEVGAMVLAEGVETLNDAEAAMDAGFNMLQGYWLARPNVTTKVEHLPERIRALREAHHIAASNSEFEVSYFKSYAEEVMARAASVYFTADDFDAAAQNILDLPWARRFWVADDKGMELRSRESPIEAFDAELLGKFAPMAPGPENCCIHRVYFREAIKRPNQVSFTGPFISTQDGARVFVIACGVVRSEKTLVLCGALMLPDTFDL
jgi:EAL domain-containing protein (putative c-di-GMP-specific phosphodiesterase class I)